MKRAAFVAMFWVAVVCTIPGAFHVVYETRLPPPPKFQPSPNRTCIVVPIRPHLWEYYCHGEHGTIEENTGSTTVIVLR